MNWCAQCGQWFNVFQPHSHAAWWPVPQPVVYFYWPANYYAVSDPKVPYLENRILYLERRVQELEQAAKK